ncbi:MAG: tsaB [Rhizobacter sp.]|nr:tsaB [Rhizobacter sp.]
MRSSSTPAATAPAFPLRAVLAFDTSTDQMSLAVAVDGRVWTHDAPGGAQASAALIPAVLTLLADAGQTLGGLQAIAFGRGPGAFTGLRTACSVAQGLAFGSDKPVLSIDTLMAVAEDARAADTGCVDVWATIDARMDEVYAAHYRYEAGREATQGNSDEPGHEPLPTTTTTTTTTHRDGFWRVESPPALYTLDALNARWAEHAPIAVAGNAIGAFTERLSTGRAVMHPDARPRAVGMIALAQSAWVVGAAVDAARALPLYLRDKVALTTIERAEVKAAKLAVAEQALEDVSASQAAETSKIAP